ncbi:MAG TPA: GSCFA domain-containing protein, partial [Ferruginibacter sp.]|nr:GSCFA domain-containing protein [Ferruginibacter sp.]
WHKFRTLDNPHGILFNPVSIAKAIHTYIINKEYKAEELFYHHELWGSWDHHTRSSSPEQAISLEMINESQQKAHRFLKNANWLLLTLGSAFVYELEDKRVVANCHKVPADKFNKRLLKDAEVVAVMQDMINELQQFNPTLNIIFTISPVRHLRDGFVENNRSKATLIHAVHQLLERNGSCFYFPAYELIIDDLRDYRFYAEDMVHPNYAATNYVWEKFITACIDEPSQQLMKEIAVIVAARNHRPFNPTSGQHKKFLQTNLEKVKKLAAEHPYIDFKEEAAFFEQQ